MSRRNRKSMVTRNIIILVFAILIFLSILYIVERNNYSDIFFNGTIINDVDCSSLSIEEAKSAIQSKEEQYNLKILFKDNDNEQISGSEISFTINNLDEELGNIKSEQRKSLFFDGKTYQLRNCTYDAEKLKNILLNKKQFQSTYAYEKSDIRYAFNPTTKLFEVNQNAYYLDFNEAFDLISTAINEQKTQVSMENLYSNIDTTYTLSIINSFIGAEITYQLPNNETYVLDANTLYTWLVQAEDESYYKNVDVWNQHIEDFVINQLAPLANTVGYPNEFLPTGLANTVLVEGGDYGYLLDVEAEIAKLKEELENQTVITRKPCYAKAPVSDENFGLGKSYIEIDLTRQKVWVYVDGVLEIETDCVTGCINKGHDTPTGIFTLTYKEENRVLRGALLANGKREYESFVNYWMPFNGGIGLHDATWRNSFGRDIYINNGSHGCINLPLEAAKKLYSIIDYDMPIIVYKSE